MPRRVTFELPDAICVCCRRTQPTESNQWGSDNTGEMLVFVKIPPGWVHLQVNAYGGLPEGLTMREGFAICPTCYQSAPANLRHVRAAELEPPPAVVTVDEGAYRLVAPGEKP